MVAVIARIAAAAVSRAAVRVIRAAAILIVVVFVVIIVHAARFKVVLLLDVLMVAGPRRRLTLPETAGRSASRLTAGTRCQKAGVHAVGHFFEVVRM